MTSIERVAPWRQAHMAHLLAMAACACVASLTAAVVHAATVVNAPTVVNPATGVMPDDARESRWADEVVPQLVVGDAVWLRTPHRERVLALHARPSGPVTGAVIVVHGLGVHPDWGLIGEIRSGLVDRGFATLSVQMPVLAADAPRDAYASLGRYAVERLDAALAWLRAHGYSHVAVLSHSMGASMVNEWMTARPGVDAWVPLGMLVPFGSRPRVPVLDVVGANDYPEALRRVPGAGELRADGCSGAITIPGADHFMQGAVPRLLDAITPFLTQALAGRCSVGAAPAQAATVATRPG